jgi:hypothetical protein
MAAIDGGRGHGSAPSAGYRARQAEKPSRFPQFPRVPQFPQFLQFPQFPRFPLIPWFPAVGRRTRLGRCRQLSRFFGWPRPLGRIVAITFPGKGIFILSYRINIYFIFEALFRRRNPRAFSACFPGRPPAAIWRFSVNFDIFLIILCILR